MPTVGVLTQRCSVTASTTVEIIPMNNDVMVSKRIIYAS